MTNPKGRAKTPREQHPILVGCTEAEAKTLERAAKACDMPRAQFIREASLAHASKCLAGVK